MKTRYQSEAGPKVVGRRNRAGRTAAASLALATATIPVAASEGHELAERALHNQHLAFHMVLAKRMGHVIGSAMAVW
jgi:hypothetical protein